MARCRPCWAASKSDALCPHMHDTSSIKRLFCLQASDDVGPTGAIIDSYMEEKDRAVADASRAVRAAAAVALEHGMPQEHIVQAAIEPVTDVTSVISAAIAHYVSTNQVAPANLLMHQMFIVQHLCPALLCSVGYAEQPPRLL